jgi:hypothetical protein
MAQKAPRPRTRAAKPQPESVTSATDARATGDATKALVQLIAECGKAERSRKAAIDSCSVWDASPIRLRVEGTKDFNARVQSLDDEKAGHELKLFFLRWHCESLRNKSSLFDMAMDADLLGGVTTRLRDKGGQKLAEEDRFFLTMLCERVERERRGVAFETNGWVQLNMPNDLSYSRDLWVSGMVLPVCVELFVHALGDESEEGYKFAKHCLSKYKVRAALPISKKQIKPVATQLAGAFLGLTPAQVDERLSPRRNRRNKITIFA